MTRMTHDWADYLDVDQLSAIKVVFIERPQLIRWEYRESHRWLSSLWWWWPSRRTNQRYMPDCGLVCCWLLQSRWGGQLRSWHCTLHTHTQRIEGGRHFRAAISRMWFATHQSAWRARNEWIMAVWKRRILISKLYFYVIFYINKLYLGYKCCQYTICLKLTRINVDICFFLIIKLKSYFNSN